MATGIRKLRRLYGDGDELYQVDVILAMLAILLVLLLTLEASVNIAPEDSSQFSYRTRDFDTDLFVMKSLQSPYIYRKILIMRNGMLTELNLDYICDSYLKTRDLDYGNILSEETGEAIIEISASKKKTITAYYFKLLIVSENIPNSLVKTAIPIKELEKKSVQNILNKSIIYVWYNQRKNLPMLGKILRSNNLPHTIYLLPNNTKSVIMNRLPSIFDLEKVLRPF